MSQHVPSHHHPDPPQPPLSSWSDGSLRRQQEHQWVVEKIEAQKIASTIDVPTLPHLVRDALRQLGEPVRLFGENLANVRDRLKWQIAIRRQRQQQAGDVGIPPFGQLHRGQREQPDDEEAVTKYTRASGSLVEARKQWTEFSLERARLRLLRERQLRVSAALNQKRRSIGDDDDTKKRPLVVDENDEKKNAKISVGVGDDDDDVDVDRLDRVAQKTFRRVRNLALEGSQYCDQRAVSCLRTVSLGQRDKKNNASLVVAGTWTASLHVMDSSLQQVGSVLQCHDDRIMAMDALDSVDDSRFFVATASLDKTAKLFRIQYSATLNGDVEPPPINEEEIAKSAVDAENVEMEDTDATASAPAPRRRDGASISGEELHCLRGHAARLCRVAFHPMRRHVATTSFDHTWRMWDVETSDCLLLQDGHARECYGIGFHPDGSLVATTDLGGIVHLWDLRTSKSVAFYRSHAGKVLNAEFHPNGFHFGTAGEDGCVHIWDVRRRTKSQRKYGAGGAPGGISGMQLAGQVTGTPLVSIPAHSGIVTGLRFDASGEFLCTSSFDGTVKLWNCRSWKLLNRLQGHQGKVTNVDMIQPRVRSQTSNVHDDNLRGIVTSGFDKTVKLWV